MTRTTMPRIRKVAGTLRVPSAEWQSCLEYRRTALGECLLLCIPGTLLFLALVLCLSRQAVAQSKSAGEAPTEEGKQLAGHAHVIFEAKCKQCHGSQLKEPEGKFGHVLDLQRVGDNAEYIVRGQPDKSELFRRLKDQEMPPGDDPKSIPLTAAERDLVRRWILAGAPAALPAVLPKLAPPADRPAVVPAAVVVAADAAKQHRVTLEFKDLPASQAFAQLATLAERAGVKLDYAPPAREPRLSMKLKDGTLHQALEYLSLCGNFSLRYDKDTARIGSNPPPALPAPAKPAPAPAKPAAK